MQYLNYKKYFQTAYLEENYTVKTKNTQYGRLAHGAGCRNSLTPLILRPGNLASNCSYEKRIINSILQFAHFL